MVTADLMRTRRRPRGFTVVELLVVLACIALLLSIAAPRVTGHLAAAREAVLRENLRAMRDAADKFYGDQGRYPASLEELVERRYLRAVPVDPVLDRTDRWVVASPAQSPEVKTFEVRSGANGLARDGSRYAQW